MSKSVLLALTLPLGLLAGCTINEPTYEYIEYPIMTLGQASLEFGEVEWGGSVERTILLSNAGDMPMGIGKLDKPEDGIIIGDAASGTSSFTVTWNAGAIECPEGATDTGTAAKGIDVDTGGGDPVDTGSTTGGDDTGGGAVDVEGSALFVLDPGCQIPLTVTYAPLVQGEAYDALVITSIGTELTEAEEAAGEDLPAYKEDPIHTQQVVYLHGESSYSAGTIVVKPRSWDFGYVHPDAAEDEVAARIEISNVGDGDVNITSAVLASTCDLETFELLNSFPETGKLLEGGDTTLSEIYFTPKDEDPARCSLLITTDDPANPEIDVALTGNNGTDPENVPPSVAVRSPENGYRYSTIRPLEIELNIFDLNQPADSLVCRVKSAVIQSVTVASCEADDESGHVVVSIPAENLEPGTDTLLISVTDGSQSTSYASVSVLINAEYPEDDDDGDGFGAYGVPADCDDTNPLTYPEAAEVFDLEDNNCDGNVDEGTEGYDDDEDGVSEAEGDCNDYSEDVYPGGPEKGDGLDNDCDGIADETTSLYDDDGDGYADVNNDCLDSDPDVNPGATEVCDGIDNNCNGLRDDGCLETEGKAIIVGDVIRMEQSACLEGEVITMDVMVFDADSDTITYSWATDNGSADFDNPAAPVVNFTCPEEPGDSANNGHGENIYAIVQDEEGQDWAFGRIAVWDDNTELYDPYSKPIIDENAGACDSTGGNPAGALMVAGALLGLALRRRA